MYYGVLIAVISSIYSPTFGADFSPSEIALAHELKKTPLAVGGSEHPLLKLVLAYLDPWRTIKSFENVHAIFAYDGHQQYGQQPANTKTTFFRIDHQESPINWNPEPYVWYVKNFETWLPQTYHAGHGYLQSAAPEPLLSECGQAQLILASTINKGKEIFSLAIECRPSWHENRTQAYAELLKKKKECTIS